MRIGLFFVLILISDSVVFAAGDPEKGRLLAETCMGCHGVNSYSNAYPTYHVPRLGGQHADYIVSALQAYKKGDRPHSTMHAQAVSLTDEQMAHVGAYFNQHGQ